MDGKPQGGRIVIIRAVDPASVVCPESILVNALTTLGVPLHPDPRLAYADFRETLPGGKIKRTLQWVLLDKSHDGVYKTPQLMKWWKDAKWLAAHPTHELTILRCGLMNMMGLAAKIRDTPCRQVFRKGRKMVVVPSRWTAEQRAPWLKKLEDAA